MNSSQHPQVSTKPGQLQFEKINGLMEGKGLRLRSGTIFRQRHRVPLTLHDDCARETTNRKHQPPNAQSDFVTCAFERFQWSKPLFVLALYTGLRRSDLRLLTCENVDLQAGVIRLLMRRTKRLVLLSIEDQRFLAEQAAAALAGEPLRIEVDARTLSRCRSKPIMDAIVDLQTAVSETSAVEKERRASARELAIAFAGKDGKGVGDDKGRKMAMERYEAAVAANDKLEQKKKRLRIVVVGNSP